MYDTSISILLLVISAVITIAAQILVSSAYEKYRKVGSKIGLSGFDVARRILDKHGLEKVHVVEVKGILGDHYDPRRKTVRLSTDVFHKDSIASLSIAAHEASHAVQDKQGYLFLKIRSLMAPVVSFGSMLGYVAIFIGFFLTLYDLITLGIILLFGIIIFELITLPVEYNASSRAKKDLIDMQILDENEMKKVSNMLHAAALTYVASLATSLLQIIRLMLLSKKRD